MVLAGVLLYATVCAQGLAPKKTIIAGEVVNYAKGENSLTVNFNDPLEDKRYVEDLDKTGGMFNTAWDCAFFQNHTVRLGNGKFMDVFAAPGDSVFVSIDMRNGKVVFAGDNAELNQEKFEATFLDGRLGRPHSLKSHDASAEEYREELMVALNEFRGYLDRSEMSDALRDWVWREHIFLVPNALWSEDGVWNESEAMWDIFSGEPFDIYDPRNFEATMFGNHLSMCASLLMKIGNVGREDVGGMIAITHEKMHKGLTRDMTLYRALRYMLEDNPALHDKKEIDAVFADPIFAERLGQIVAHANSRPVMATQGKITLNGTSYLAGDKIETLPDGVKLMGYLHEKYAGKVIYIDVWATWCGPCLNQMKYAPALHEYFEGKDVVFVNLCMACEVETWLPTIARHNIGGENYFMSGDTALFNDEQKIYGYPTYIIIDKTGTLHNTDIPWPSNTTGTIEIINALL